MIIEERLSFDDEPGLPLPPPTPAVVVPVAPRVRLAFPAVKTLLPYLVMALAIGFGGWQWYRNRDVAPKPVPTPTVDATKDGAAWAKELPLTFADSFAQAQADVKGSDKTLDAIRKEHVERWKASRDAAFNKRFVPTLDQVIPPGNDKPTMEDRRRYAEVMGQIVEGVREGAK